MDTEVDNPEESHTVSYVYESGGEDMYESPPGRREKRERGSV